MQCADGGDAAVVREAPRGQIVRRVHGHCGAHAAGRTARRRTVNQNGSIGKRRRSGRRAEGTLLRGVERSAACKRDGDILVQVKRRERTRIERRPGGAICYEEGGEWFPLAEGTSVSLNVWGFQHSFMEEAEARFPAFLERAQREDPLKAEYFLPSVVSQLIAEEKAQVKVLHSRDKWYGVTYREDLASVKDAIRALKAAGVYEERLWPDTKD